MDYVWCHGPKCHQSHTQDRIRGVKGSKVLRTRKIAQNNWNSTTQWSHFCSQGCWNDFAFAHWEEFINLHPKATEVVPIFGKMFTNEPVPIKGEVTLTDLPGFGAELNTEVDLEEI